MDTKKMYVNKEDAQALELAVALNEAVLLVGETGTGKTSIVYDLGKQKNKKVIRINLTGETTIEDVVGKMFIRKEANGQTSLIWQDGLLTQAVKQGDWIIFDELNIAIPEVLACVHSLLDDDRKIVLKENKGEEVKAHEEFRFFATINPPDEYTGTKELNKALVSRFGVILNVGYSDKERDIVTERADVDGKTADTLVRLANHLRAVKVKGDISYICSTRDLIQAGTLIKNGLSVERAIELTIINKAPQDERQNIVDVVKLVTGKNIKLFEGTSNEKIFDGLADIERDLDNKERELERRALEIKELTKQNVYFAKQLAQLVGTSATPSATPSATITPSATSGRGRVNANVAINTNDANALADAIREIIAELDNAGRLKDKRYHVAKILRDKNLIN